MNPEATAPPLSPEELSDLCQKSSRTCGGEQFYIQEYFQIQKLMGHGAYGTVCSALDLRNNTMVAIKKVTIPSLTASQIKDVFVDLVDAKRILREIKVLSTLSSVICLEFVHHANVIKLLEVIQPCEPDFSDVYLVFEYMPTDLEKVISSKMNLTDEHIKFFMYQLLRGIFYLHSGDIIHRDLKPDNLLVNKKCELKLADMGLARKFEDMEKITEYVVTRWYRAPEIILSSQDYSKSIDIWSIGCIFAELMGRTPLFQGRHLVDQIQRIIAVMGTPDLSKLSYKIDVMTNGYLLQMPKRQKQDWRSIFLNQTNPLAFELLDKMLQYDPLDRFSALECLNHPYFSKFHTGEREVYTRCGREFDWGFDQVQLEKEVMREAILREMGQ